MRYFVKDNKGNNHQGDRRFIKDNNHDYNFDAVLDFSWN